MPFSHSVDNADCSNACYIYHISHTDPILYKNTQLLDFAAVSKILCVHVYYSVHKLNPLYSVLHISSMEYVMIVHEFEHHFDMYIL